MDWSVAVLDFDAQARGRTLRLAGEAKTMDEVLAFVERLRKSKRLDDVYLLGHEARKVGAADVIAFTVQATWPMSRDSAR
jgi:Tfp pilus assembly protein PilN